MVHKPMIPPGTCSAGNMKTYCCQVDSWDKYIALGEGAMRFYGEPLDTRTVEVATNYSIDPHDLDYHVEGKHGWETHDSYYSTALTEAAECMIDAGYREHLQEFRCRNDE